jgi:hypothetical protein
VHLIFPLEEWYPPRRVNGAVNGQRSANCLVVERDSQAMEDLSVTSHELVWLFGRRVVTSQGV